MTTNEIYFNMVKEQLEQFVPVTKAGSMRQLQDDIKFLSRYTDKLTWYEFQDCCDIIYENITYTVRLFKAGKGARYYFKRQVWAIKNNYKFNNGFGNDYRARKYFL